VKLAGFGARANDVGARIEKELKCPVASLLSSEATMGRGLQPLLQHDMDALVGWSLNRGA